MFRFCLPLLLLICQCPLHGQETPPPVPSGLSGQDAHGFIVAPVLEESVYLHDLAGKKLKEWKTGYQPAGAPRPLSSGGLLHMGGMTVLDGIDSHFLAALGRGGLVQEFGSDGSLRWRFRMASAEYFVHDDALQLRNGNFLMLVWRWQSSDEWLAAGRAPTSLDLEGMWIDEIWEVKPTTKESGTVVWRWSAWDYRVQDTTREVSGFGDCQRNWRSINLNHPARTQRAWANLRRIEYCEEEGLIAVWSQSFNELWIVDHRKNNGSETPLASSEAPREGLVYRAGNPELFSRKVSNKDVRLGFRDMMIVKDGEEWVLSVLHGYQIKDVGPRQALQNILLSKVRGAASGSQPPILLRAQDSELGKFGLSEGQQIQGICNAGDTWILTSSATGEVLIAQSEGKARPVFKVAKTSMQTNSSPSLTKRPGFLITKAATAIITRN